MKYLWYVSRVTLLIIISLSLGACAGYDKFPEIPDVGASANADNPSTTTIDPDDTLNGLEHNDGVIVRPRTPGNIVILGGPESG